MTAPVIAPMPGAYPPPQYAQAQQYQPAPPQAQGAQVFCSKCGTPNVMGAAFCKNCATPLMPPPQQYQQAPQGGKYP